MNRQAATAFWSGGSLDVGCWRRPQQDFRARAALVLPRLRLLDLPSELLQLGMDWLPGFRDRARMKRACRATSGLDWRVAPPLYVSEELGGLQLGDKGACSVAEALIVPPNDSMGELCLGDNGIGDIGAEAIAVALCSGAKLRRLSLRNNNIGDDGAEALAAILSMNTMLEEIDLWGNRFTHIGKRVLLSMAKCSVFLEVDPAPCLVPRPTAVSEKMHSVLFDWISQVLTGINVPLALDGSLDPQDMLFRTFMYMDSYLSCKNIQRPKLQLASIACMLAAAGVFGEARIEDDTELTAWLSFITDGTLLPREVAAAVEDIRDSLGFHLHRPTVYTFLRRYLRKMGWTEESFSLANYFAEVAATAPSMQVYKPRTIAAAAAILSRQYVTQGIRVRHIPNWKEKLLVSANVDLRQELAPCMAALSHLHASVHKQSLFVNKKYKWTRLHMVALIPPNPPSPAGSFVRYMSTEDEA